MTTAWRLGAVLVLAGCGSANAGQSDPQACAPVESDTSAVETAADIGGEYSVRLVATSGAQRGATAQGRLDLMPRDSAYRRLTLPDGTRDTTFAFPLYGTAEVDFASVGAVAPGDPKSADPLSPGVLVIERPSGVMLRVGSVANRWGMRRFDGAYTALQVQQVTEEGFKGTWRSGVGTEQSGGHFCAVRAS
ncbi:MAG TPA: hypothetical protein VHG35_17850 [Gemmatimonadales bacterium]|nr:hypothetical protein [Gemmatimonadales bacterium]